MLKISTLFTLLFLIALSMAAYARTYHLSDFENQTSTFSDAPQRYIESPGLKSTLEVLTIKDTSYFRAALNPDFNIGPVGVGFDLNSYTAIGDHSGVPFNKDLQPLVLRSLYYETPDFGAKWGRLRYVTYGTGLMVRNYDSGTAGSTLFTAEKGGLSGHVTIGKFNIEALKTGSEFSAIRTSFPIISNVGFGKDLILGMNWANDSNGVFNQDGSTLSPPVTGYSTDLTLPVFGPLFRLYSEYATLSGRGSGWAMGFGGTADPFFDYRLEYRSFGTRFLPGYFNDFYESNPLALTPRSSNTEGIFGFAGFNLNNYIRSEISIELYNNIPPSLTASLGWRPLFNVVGVVNYVQTFATGANPGYGTETAEFLYLTGGAYDYLFNIKRVYNSLGYYDQSYSVGVRVNVSKFFGLK